MTKKVATSSVNCQTLPKILLISSSGGHFEQLMKLTNLQGKKVVVTEKTTYNTDDPRINYFLPQVNRKELLFPFKMLIIALKSFRIFLKEQPGIVISTGVLAAIPMLYLGHKFHKKVIYIESFAKINDPTLTGKLVYQKKLADRFYVQWPSMQKIFPNAIYKGGIY